MIGCKLVVKMTPEIAAQFNAQLTGNDRDIVLAAELAMKDKLGLDRGDDRLQVEIEEGVPSWA